MAITIICGMVENVPWLAKHVGNGVDGQVA